MVQDARERDRPRCYLLSRGTREGDCSKVHGGSSLCVLCGLQAGGQLCLSLSLSVLLLLEGSRDLRREKVFFALFCPSLGKQKFVTHTACSQARERKGEGCLLVWVLSAVRYVAWFDGFEVFFSLFFCLVSLTPCCLKVFPLFLSLWYA